VASLEVVLKRGKKGEPEEENEVRGSWVL